jgi:hypothetical protein
MQALEQNAHQEFDRLYEQCKSEIAQFKEQHRKYSDKLRLASTLQQAIPWVLPNSIAFRCSAEAPTFERHLYIEQDNTFRVNLCTWEKCVLQ